MGGQPRTLRIISLESCAVEPGSRPTKTYSTSGSDDLSAGADGPRAARNDSAASSDSAMMLFNTTRQLTPDPWGTGVTSLWTEMWPTQPVVTQPVVTQPVVSQDVNRQSLGDQENCSTISTTHQQKWVKARRAGRLASAPDDRSAPLLTHLFPLESSQVDSSQEGR